MAWHNQNDYALNVDFEKMIIEGKMTLNFIYNSLLLEEFIDWGFEEKDDKFDYSIKEAIECHKMILTEYLYRE